MKRELYKYQIVNHDRVLEECEAESLTDALRMLGDDLSVEYQFRFAATVRSERRGHVFLIQWQPIGK